MDDSGAGENGWQGLELAAAARLDAVRTGDIGTEMMNVANQSLIRIRIKNVGGGHRSGKQATTAT
jgi:hypothetical protein